MIFFRKKQSKLDAIHKDIYDRIDTVTKNTAEASKSYDQVNELLDKGGFAGAFFLASPGGGKFMDKKVRS